MKSKASAALLLATALVCTTTATAQTALDAGSIAPPAPTINDTRDKGPADPLSVLPEDVKKYGSLYLRCDGQPNNITGAESFARLLGAVTLLALFAPPPEAGNPSKRLLAERGVAACSKLLDDPKEETNGLRRLPLILARAVHQFEAKDYKAALADVTKARGEAQALGLIGNSYFDRSMGLSFNLLESQALLRLGQPAEARQVSLRNALAMPYSFYAGISTRPYSSFQRSMSTEEEQYYRNMSRISAFSAWPWLTVLTKWDASPKLPCCATRRSASSRNSTAIHSVPGHSPTPPSPMHWPETGHWRPNGRRRPAKTWTP
ncbi:hypothetical protein [Novosphingobium sp. ST904]|uniref:hypothetical protein n=1 Tax=Novosphingobium sp. ST904 TaxID=1684385 RepID=UPI0006C8BFA9|nr:hypothetical protein [Novosphingobium sp. ST904]